MEAHQQGSISACRHFQESGQWGSIAGSLAAGEPDSPHGSSEHDARMSPISQGTHVIAAEPDVSARGGRDKGDVRVSLNEWTHPAHASQHSNGDRGADAFPTGQHSMHSSSNASDTGIQPSKIESRCRVLQCSAV